MYTSFAEVYDQLMDNVNYERWADFYAEMLHLNGVGVGEKVCECACGTGGLTIPLVKRGFQMTGVDLSQEMLWIAAQKARKMGLGLPSSSRICASSTCTGRWTRCWPPATA